MKVQIYLTGMWKLKIISMLPREFNSAPVTSQKMAKSIKLRDEIMRFLVQ